MPDKTEQVHRYQHAVVTEVPRLLASMGLHAPRTSLRTIARAAGRIAAMGMLDIADRTWPLLRRVMGGHTQVYRLTRGAIGHRFPGAAPMLLLDHVGARSGVKRTAPLVYIADGADVVIVASKGGHPRNPAWFHNLKANPDTTVQIGSEIRRVHAHVADAAERERLWPKAVAAYSGYTDYQARTEREIPLVVLSSR